MPNNCYNDLEIIGDKELLDTILSNHFNDEQSLDFNTVIPYPEECKKADAEESEKAGFPHVFSEIGYKWCIENWGTKWNAYDTQLRRLSDDKVLISFNTAWSPPNPIIGRLGEMYKEASFSLHYEDEGFMFQGDYEVSKGEVTKDATYDCEENDEEEGEE